MPEFWQKTHKRGMETVTFWRKFFPLMSVAGTGVDQHAANLDQLGRLAQERENRKTAAKQMKNTELAQFAAIRTLNLAVPQLITAQFDESHPVRQSLAAVFTIVPRSDALNLRRARILIPIWKQANAELAKRPSGTAIMRDTTDVAAFEQMVMRYPERLQETSDAEAALTSARGALRIFCRQVDRMNKRAYLKFSAEARTDATVREVLLASITREKPSHKRA